MLLLADSNLTLLREGVVNHCQTYMKRYLKNEGMEFRKMIQIKMLSSSSHCHP